VYCDSTCPGPDTVSAYIQHGSALLLLNDKVHGYDGLYSIYNGSYTVYKGGMTTGLTTGYIVEYEYRIYRNDAFFGPISYMSNDVASGDSGGIVYTRMGMGRDISNIAMGTVVGYFIDRETGTSHIYAYIVCDQLLVPE